MLFSEPKIPHVPVARRTDNAGVRFSALQRAENSSLNVDRVNVVDIRVSVLFSEPKIPHQSDCLDADADRQGFSALQRAENSSPMRSPVSSTSVSFQCSSASRKFLTITNLMFVYHRAPFQCSSASRKFLTIYRVVARSTANRFQCSSASRKFLTTPHRRPARVFQRFQCSSASRKFLTIGAPNIEELQRAVSVLFSEPKIPHQQPEHQAGANRVRFSALQRAENSSLKWRRFGCGKALNVSVLFSEPKIPHRVCATHLGRNYEVSVLFSEPKIPHHQSFSPSAQRA